jgi:hypothetical protein
VVEEGNTYKTASRREGTSLPVPPPSCVSITLSVSTTEARPGFEPFGESQAERSSSDEAGDG